MNQASQKPQHPAWTKEDEDAWPETPVQPKDIAPSKRQAKKEALAATKKEALAATKKEALAAIKRQADKDALGLALSLARLTANVTEAKERLSNSQRAVKSAIQDAPINDSVIQDQCPPSRTSVLLVHQPSASAPLSSGTTSFSPSPYSPTAQPVPSATGSYQAPTLLISPEEFASRKFIDLSQDNIAHEDLVSPHES